MAQDKGYPPLSRTVEVQIDVVDRANNPPVWDSTVYGPIYVKENMPVGGKVVSIKARSVPTVVELSFPILSPVSLCEFELLFSPVFFVVFFPCFRYKHGGALFYASQSEVGEGGRLYCFRCVCYGFGSFSCFDFRVLLFSVVPCSFGFRFV